MSDAYHQLIPRAYKADLARSCLLYVYGGVYADLGARFFRPIVEFQPNKLHVLRDSFGAAPWIVSNSIIAAPRKLPLFEEVIRNMVRNCNQKFYGETPLCPTGPNLIGRCLATHAKIEDIEVGETVKISRNSQIHSFAHIPQNGEILAVNAKIGAGLSSLGAPFCEDYGEIYRKKGVYQ